jgi:predicted glycoside hydrolase/deacetylase ChbG (UPF0249 family)
MESNPVLRRLGYAARDRVVIIHADDIGMCQAGIAALDSLLTAGTVSSMAVMAPCPWFPAAAAFCRAHPQVDMGLHGTITSEWDAYRWGPLSTRDPSSGLLDPEGFFFRRSESVQESAGLEAVTVELEAQVRRALSAGIDLTHIDGHMYTLFHPKFLAAYLQTAAQHQLPALCFRFDEARARQAGYEAAAAAEVARFTAQLEEQGVPLFDHVFVMPLDDAEDRLAVTKRALADLPPGLSYFILHPAMDTPELRAIAPDWRCRAADYEVFAGDAIREWLKPSGLQVIGWRPLRELVRRASSGG